MIHTFRHVFSTGVTATAQCGLDLAGRICFSVKWRSKATGREIIRDHTDEYRRWRAEIFGRVFPGAKVAVIEV